MNTSDGTHGPSPEAARPAAGRWSPGRLAGLVGPPLLLFTLFMALHPFLDVVVFDPDEGNNLMKARLVAEGHALYAEVWNDQPPLFTWVLRAWLGATSWSVEAGRLLIMLCSCVLVWAFYQTLRLTVGHLGAIASCVLLVVSSGYLRLSGAVMLAVPSLMFAMLALLVVIRWRSGGRPAWLAASGALLALAVGVKLWTGLLIPIALLAVWAASARTSPAGGTPVNWRRPVAWWAGGFAAALAVLLLATVPLGEIGQLLRPHLDVRGTHDFQPHLAAFWDHFREDLPIVLVAGLGIAVVATRQITMASVPIAWGVLATIVLSRHEPLWYHHYLMVSIPLCWLAGIAVAELPAVLRDGAWRTAEGRRAARTWGVAAIAAAAAVLLVVRVPEIHDQEIGQWSQRDMHRDLYLVDVMARLGDDTRFVVTDRQIIPFRAGLSVPPELAVTSLKRQWAGHLSGERFIELLAVYRPEQIYLSGHRIEITKELSDWFGPRYRPLYSDPWGGLYLVRNDLADAGLAAVVEATDAYAQCWEAQLNLAEFWARANRPAEAQQALDRASRALPDGSVLDPVRRRIAELTQLSRAGE